MSISLHRKNKQYAIKIKKWKKRPVSWLSRLIAQAEMKYLNLCQGDLTVTVFAADHCWGCVLFRFFSHLWDFACLATRGHSLWAELDVIMLGCPSRNRVGWKGRFRLSNLSSSGILYEFIRQASTVELKQFTLQGRHRWDVRTFFSNILWLRIHTKSCTSASPHSQSLYLLKKPGVWTGSGFSLLCSRVPSECMECSRSDSRPFPCN